MSLSRYGDYKPVEFGWLRELPSHWEVFPLKRAAELGCLKRDVAAVDRYVGLENVSSWTGRIAVAEVPAEGLGIEFGAGDVLFGKLRPYLAKVALAETSGIASTEFLILRGKRVDPSFLRYSMVSRPFIDAVNASTYGAKMPRASWEDIGSLPQPIPPPAEQRAIAAFLDRETAKIDALIARQEELIERIEEARIALLETAMTSGIEGDSSTMEMVPLKWLVQISSGEFPPTGDVSPEPTSQCPFPMIGGNGIMGYVSKSNTRRPLAVIGRVGALCGNAHKVDYPAWVTDNALMVEPSSKVDLDFLFYALDWLNLNRLANQSAQPLITGTMVKAQEVPAPSISEQERICVWLSEKLRALATLGSRADQVQAKLRERRAALITAAVTGQIEVAANIAAEAAA